VRPLVAQVDRAAQAALALDVMAEIAVDRSGVLSPAVELARRACERP
jgi:hypothetical protein